QLLDDSDEEFPILDDDYSISPSSIPKTLSYASSSSNQFREVTCNICMEDKTFEMFPNKGSCGHLFCSDCISKHIDAKIKENITIITCPEPNCKNLIKPEVCRDRSLVPKEVLDRWDNALCESLIKGSEKFYCPFKDCSALLVDDGGEAVTSSECPHCNRLFCARCKVSWHAGMDCEEYQSLIKKGKIARSDSMLMDLAKNKKWKRCPNCNIYVERTTGCEHIACRCGYQFCYECGNEDRSLVPKEVLDRWDNALCESLIKGSEKFYCPFKDCSALLVDDGGEAVTSSECPHCNRLFCARCKVSWHAGMDCEEYQSLIKKGKIARSDSYSPGYDDLGHCNHRVGASNNTMAQDLSSMPGEHVWPTDLGDNNYFQVEKDHLHDSTACAFPIKDSRPVVKGRLSVCNKWRRVLNKGSAELDSGLGQEINMRARRVAQDSTLRMLAIERPVARNVTRLEEKKELQKQDHVTCADALRNEFEDREAAINKQREEDRLEWQNRLKDLQNIMLGGSSHPPSTDVEGLLGLLQKIKIGEEGLRVYVEHDRRTDGNRYKRDTRRFVDVVNGDNNRNGVNNFDKASNGVGAHESFKEDLNKYRVDKGSKRTIKIGDTEISNVLLERSLVGEVRRESKLDLRKGSSTQSLIRRMDNQMEGRLDDKCMQIDDEEGGMKGESINEV
nr:zinc finger, C6HC-type [Tanacetum cinerariifolium]